jgi:hypothetical protein
MGAIGRVVLILDASNEGQDSGSIKMLLGQNDLQHLAQL